MGKKRHEASRPSTVHGGPWGLGLGAGPARPEPPEEEGARALPARVRELWSDTEETTSDGRLDQGVRGLMRLRVRVRSLHVRPAGDAHRTGVLPRRPEASVVRADRASRVGG